MARLELRELALPEYNVCPPIHAMHKGVKFGGFQGCVRYKPASTAIMYTQEEASLLLATFPKVDVLLCHCPPFGVNDDPSDLAHTGFVGLREYVFRCQPRYLFHGHTYPAVPQTRLDQTEIVYVYGDKNNRYRGHADITLGGIKSSSAEKHHRKFQVSRILIVSRVSFLLCG